MTKTLMTRATALAREIMDVTDCTPCELRDVVPHLMPCHMGPGLTDFTVHLGGNDWRFINMDVIDTILEEELTADPYILGCFNASFIAGVTGWPIELIEAAQNGDKCEAIGQGIIDGGFVYDMAEGYSVADGYGHHFAHYDGDTHEINCEGFYAFNLG